MRNRVIEGGKVKITDPTQLVSIELANSMLERGVSVLPSAEKEDAVPFLQNDVAKNRFELKWCASRLHSLCR